MKSGEPRNARIRAFAKVNLCLEVLQRRPDGFHNIRSLFQTISLCDILEIDFLPGAASSLELDSAQHIPNNLVLRAAEALKIPGQIRFRLTKRIPMGGGLGGGSTDAAAVLLALPVLSGTPIPWSRLLEIGESLGSDVPYFLLGGTALGLGRGTELYPVAEAAAGHVLLVTPNVHSSTAEAYQSLARTRDYEAQVDLCSRASQQLAIPGGTWEEWCRNDFEDAIFSSCPELARIRTRLVESGARLARMTGSGSALFGFFDNEQALRKAQISLRDTPSVAVRTVSRAQYRRTWLRQLGVHVNGGDWPPRSAYC